MTKPPIFTLEEIAPLENAIIPRHVAIIPDGNRRWTKKHREFGFKGHYAGADVLIRTVKAGKELGIKVMTFYLFSTENWNRPREEVAALMCLLREFLRRHCKEMQENGFRLKTIGDIKALPQEVLKAIDETCRNTAHCNQMDVIFALNYGGRDDIIRAIHKIIDDNHSDKITREQITESLISQHLDTAVWGDPELLIRTSGELRISNFLLWQISYSEIHVTEVLWPDFSPQDLLKAVIDFQKRERRWGGT